MNIGNRQQGSGASRLRFPLVCSIALIALLIGICIGCFMMFPHEPGVGSSGKADSTDVWQQPQESVVPQQAGQTPPEVVQVASSNDIEIQGTYTHQGGDVDRNAGTLIECRVTNTGRFPAPNVTMIADCSGFQFAHSQEAHSRFAGYCSWILGDLRNLQPGESRSIRYVLPPILDASIMTGTPEEPGWGICGGDPLQISLRTEVNAFQY